jgi:hypothetical protein
MSWHYVHTFVVLVTWLQLGTEGQREGDRWEEVVGMEREGRSILGGERTEHCPAQCLCLSEIQVI